MAERDFRWLRWVWLAGLYLGGVFLWGKFLNWGAIPFDFHDWAEISAARLAFVRDAVLKGVLPLHMNDAAHLRGITDRYLAIPDAVFSPQLLLLRFLEVGPFFLVNTLLLYTLGCLGLLWLRRRFSLSLLAFSILFLLFNFNGHILAHTSVGHATWGGYFLFPWLAALIFRLLDGEQGWRWVAQVSLLLFFIYLQGSFHHFVWALFFLGFLGLSSWKHLWPALKALVFAVLLSMVRILPPALELGKFDNEFLGGYPSVLDLLQAMVVIKLPAEALAVRSPLNLLGWWEFDLYIGVLGAVFFFFFGVFRWLKGRRPGSGYPALLLPVTALAVLSLGRIYRLVMLLPLPLVAGERASIRFIILPFVILLILAVVEFQEWLRSARLSPLLRLAGLGGMLALGHDLWQHFKVWQVTSAYPAFAHTPVDLAIKIVGNRSDPPYFAALTAGFVISLTALGVLIFLVWRESRKNQSG